MAAEVLVVPAVDTEAEVPAAPAVLAVVPDPLWVADIIDLLWVVGSIIGPPWAAVGDTDPLLAMAVAAAAACTL